MVFGLQEKVTKREKSEHHSVLAFFSFLLAPRPFIDPAREARHAWGYSPSAKLPKKRAELKSSPTLSVFFQFSATLFRVDFRFSLCYNQQAKGEKRRTLLGIRIVVLFLQNYNQAQKTLVALKFVLDKILRVLFCSTNRVMIS